MSANPAFQLDNAKSAFLQKQWAELLTPYQTPNRSGAYVFDLINRHYSEPRRHYHNLSHIWALLGLAEKTKTKINDYDSVRWAIWLHDVIYDTRRKDNEELSAMFAEMVLPVIGLPEAKISDITRMIVATRDHSIESASEDARLFLDLDLSILGASAEIYISYAEAVRREYSWVPYFLYRRARRKILENFMGRDKIFNTEVMSNRLEKKARLNIGSELERLSNRPCPNLRE